MQTSRTSGRRASTVRGRTDPAGHDLHRDRLPVARARPPDRLPPVFGILDSTTRFISNGRGLDPENVTPGPFGTFLLTAVLGALLLQRIIGLR